MKLVFEKYHCMGNDYLVYDPNKNSMDLNQEQVKLVCDRNFGIGSDGILVGPILDGEKMYMKILNPDGSEVKKSGNGVGIFARYLKDAGYVQKNFASWMTLGGEVSAHFLNEEGTRLKISMGTLSFWSDEIPVTGERREMVDQTMFFGDLPYLTTCVTIGNPHCVIWMSEISKEEACRLGAECEASDSFPEKTNTELLHVIDRSNIEIEIYERGVGYTLASGSSACAAAGAAHKLGLVNDKMYVRMPGGTLEVEIQADGTIFMVGDVGYVGKITLGNELVEKLRVLA